MSAIECTYLIRARCLKIYLLYFTVLNTTLLRWIKGQSSLAIENRNSGTSVVPTLAHGNSKNTYDIELWYEEDIPMAYL